MSINKFELGGLRDIAQGHLNIANSKHLELHKKLVIKKELIGGDEMGVQEVGNHLNYAKDVISKLRNGQNKAVRKILDRDAATNGKANANKFDSDLERLNILDEALDKASSESHSTSRKYTFWSGGDFARRNALSYAKINDAHILGIRGTAIKAKYEPEEISDHLTNSLVDWNVASKRYAEEAQGTVTAFIHRPAQTTKNVWETVEQPTLSKNSMIDKVQILEV